MLKKFIAKCAGITTTLSAGLRLEKIITAGSMILFTATNVRSLNTAVFLVVGSMLMLVAPLFPAEAAARQANQQTAQQAAQEVAQLSAQHAARSAVQPVNQQTNQQTAGAQDMIILARDDGSAYILHSSAIPLSHGFHVHRRVEGGEWERLTEHPVFPAQNGYQLKRSLGTLFPFVARELRQTDPQQIFLSVRAEIPQNIIATAAMPELARALGRAYVDEQAPLGEQVSYRIEIVSDTDRPTGRVIEGSALLRPEKPLAPSDVHAEHEGRRITLNWRYPTPGDRPETINTIRFRTFSRDLTTGFEADVTDVVLVRTRDDRDFSKIFQVPALNREYEFRVEAVDISGRRSGEGASVRLLVTDNVAPDIISGVQSRLTADYESLITWPVSPAIDLAGYHVYMSMGDDEEYTRLTDELLPPLQTVFLHADPIPGMQYRYAVTAVDESGNESELSNPTHLYIWDATTPDPVSGLIAVFDPDDKHIRIGWTGPGNMTSLEDRESPGSNTSAGDRAATGDRTMAEDETTPGSSSVHQHTSRLRTYQILRRQVHPKSGELFDQLNTSAHLEEFIIDTGYGGRGFVEGVFLEYGVVAVGVNGNRSDTMRTVIQVPDLTPPEPPTTVQAQMRSEQVIQVTWNASVSGDVTRYRLYRLESGSDEPLLLHEGGRGNRFFRDATVQRDQEYVFSVTAVDSVGNESVPVMSSPIVAHRMHPPDRVQNLQAYHSEEGVLLQWQVLDESQVEGFRIYRSRISTGIYEPIGETGAGERRFIHPESEVGQWFKVFPFDAAGRQSMTAVAVQAVGR